MAKASLHKTISRYSNLCWQKEAVPNIWGLTWQVHPPLNYTLTPNTNTHTLRHTTQGNRQRNIDAWPYLLPQSARFESRAKEAILWPVELCAHWASLRADVPPPWDMQRGNKKNKSGSLGADNWRRFHSSLMLQFTQTHTHIRSRDDSLRASSFLRQEFLSTTACGCCQGVNAIWEM